MSWNMRNLTILGKVTVSNHLILPKLIFSSQLWEILNKFINMLENIVYKFIWDSKDKIKLNTLKAEIAHGG